MRYLREQQDPYFQVDEKDKGKFSEKKTEVNLNESKSQGKTTAGSSKSESLDFTKYAVGAGLGAVSFGLVGKTVGFSFLGGVIVGAVVGVGIVYINNKKE
jgi:hypothetical protein